MFLSWWPRGPKKPSHWTGCSPFRAPRYRPQLEALETRLTPASLTIQNLIANPAPSVPAGSVETYDFDVVTDPNTPPLSQVTVLELLPPGMSIHSTSFTDTTDFSETRGGDTVKWFAASILPDSPV